MIIMCLIQDLSLELSSKWYHDFITNNYTFSELNLKVVISFIPIYALHFPHWLNRLCYNKSIYQCVSNLRINKNTPTIEHSKSQTYQCHLLRDSLSNSQKLITFFLLGVSVTSLTYQG